MCTENGLTGNFYCKQKTETANFHLIIANRKQKFVSLVVNDKQLSTFIVSVNVPMYGFFINFILILGSTKVLEKGHPSVY